MVYYKEKPAFGFDLKIEKGWKSSGIRKRRRRTVVNLVQVFIKTKMKD